MFSLVEIENDIKSAVTKVEHLILTPQTQHPVLEDLRQMLIKQAQQHLQGVSTLVTAWANQILQQVELSLTTPAAIPTDQIKPLGDVASVPDASAPASTAGTK